MEEPTPITEFLAEITAEVAAESSRKSGDARGKSLPRCSQVFVDKKDQGKTLPYWRAVGRGIYYNIRILYASPQPCVIAPTSKIVYSESCSYSFREAENNVIIEEDCGTGRKHLYAYPRDVWKELYEFYVKPLTEDKEPYNVGVILMGPPGTGKSRLAKIIAKYSGINVYTIDTGLLSKWVGESENKLRNIIQEARKNHPSIVILDDAEWILVARNLSDASAEGMAGVRLNLQQILFSAMQEIYDRREKVLFIATTNVKQDSLDPALVRHGRFGPPIFVPLPDLEAAKIIVKEVLPDKPEEEIERIAFLAVNAGLSIADTIALAERVRRGGEPKPRTVGGRGYARIFVERVDEFEKLEREYRIPLSDMLSARSRLAILGNEDIATAFAVQLAYSSKKTVIKLVDARYIDEAIHSANMLGSVFIAPTRLAPEVQYYIHDNLDVSLILVGERPPVVPNFTLGDVQYLIKRVGVRASVKAVAALKGLKVSDGLMKKIMAKVSGDYNMAEKILRMIVTTGTLNEEYFENLISWMQ